MKQAHPLNLDAVERELYIKLKERKPDNVPVNEDGSITKTHNNTVDALRHSYLSGVETQFLGELFAKVGGYIFELRFNNPENEKIWTIGIMLLVENMDY